MRITHHAKSQSQSIGITNRPNSRSFGYHIGSEYRRRRYDIPSQIELKYYQNIWKDDDGDEDGDDIWMWIIIISYLTCKIPPSCRMTPTI